MLDGKELEKQMGEYGSVSVDVKPTLEVEVSLVAKVDIVAELEKLAAKTSTTVDDKVVAAIKTLKEYLAKN